VEYCFDPSRTLTIVRRPCVVYIVISEYDRIPIHIRMKTLAVTIFLLTVLHTKAQVNAYARVTAITSTTISVTSPVETYALFAAGAHVIVMQMQDNVIGANTSNNASFGNLTTMASAGTYEVALVQNVVRSARVVTNVIISSPLAKTFNIGANGTVQLISYPVLGTNGFTTSADITALSWNGNVGGVVAFRVNGTLILNHSITADFAGFRGGAANGGNAGTCESGDYRIAANELNANKGEGIFRVTNSSHVAGRGKVINGGGGGNSHNGGGGGGGNITAGGLGGRGYGCTQSAGGIGGIDMSMFVSGDRVFMGGGGGAGEANNNFNTAGGNGGGIIIVKADEIRTTGTGSALRISANGQTPANVGNDGAGGGGAGGAIMLVVQNWNISAGRSLTISANGANGGNVGDAAAHGGGGGGGQGAVLFSTAIPTNNITTTTLNGSGGRNYAGGTFADNGAGTHNAGILNASFAVLNHSAAPRLREVSESAPEQGILLYPNPVHSRAVLKLYYHRKASAQLSITDSYGLRVYATEIALKTGVNDIEIVLPPSLRPGVYQLEVKSESMRSVIRMIRN